jgi:two-component system sensor histidine kinase BaeS
LYSAEQQFIAGVDIGHMDDRISLALPFDDRIVGYLYSSPIREVESSSATAFSQQQHWTSLGIGLLCLLLASTTAWWLSRFLLIPVKQVMLGCRIYLRVIMMNAWPLNARMNWAN